PNVPYYIDANVKLTQSIAILRYLGRKHGLVARDETGLVRQDLVEQQLLDYRTGFYQIVHNKDNFESTKAKYITETLPQQLDQLSKFLGSHQWFVGQTLTYVDFLAYETLDWIRVLSAETVKKYHNLVQYLDRFENLPQINAYLKKCKDCESTTVMVYPAILDISQKGKGIGIDYYDIHPEYQKGNTVDKAFDVALIKLETEFHFSRPTANGPPYRTANSICLPVRDIRNEREEYARVAGFG
ncbi:unnamed protein product, partial [Oppiella nova]